MAELIIPLFFTLMVAPNASDLAVETQSDDFNHYVSLAACEADLKILQMKNPDFHFWCE